MAMSHPEQQDDEIYLGNDDQDSFKRCGWTTKRQGETARGLDGKPLQGSAAVALRPVFVKRSEIEAALRSTRDEAAQAVYKRMLSNGTF